MPMLCLKIWCIFPSLPFQEKFPVLTGNFILRLKANLSAIFLGFNKHNLDLDIF